MDVFKIRGGNTLKGDIYVQGSKNAATKLIAATLLTKEPCKLKGLPAIRDVDVMLEILEDMGSRVERLGDEIVIQNSDTDPSKLPHDKVMRLRSSIVLIGPFLARFGQITMPYPGGDPIGARSLGTHFNVFSDMGYSIDAGDALFSITKTPGMSPRRKVVLDEFSVTATENFLMAASLTPEEFEVSIAAEEPHVQNLSEFLNKMGAQVSILPGHRIRIKGASSLRGAEHDVVRDYIEAGTFVITGLLAGDGLRIHNFPTEHLDLFLHKMRRFGGDVTVEASDRVYVKKGYSLSVDKVQTMIYPGIPTDLQSPLGILATQSSGTTLIHDPLYSGRLDYLKELQKMGANVNIIDIHRAEVTGPTKLRGVAIRGEDIRGGMSLIIAGLIADGETVLENAYQVDRGYEKIEERLCALGAEIDRIKITSKVGQ